MVGMIPLYIICYLDTSVIPNTTSTQSALIVVVNLGLSVPRRIGMQGVTSVKSVATNVEIGVVIRMNLLRTIILLYRKGFLVVCIRGEESGCVSVSKISVDAMTPILPGFTQNGLRILVNFSPKG